MKTRHNDLLNSTRRRVTLDLLLERWHGWLARRAAKRREQMNRETAEELERMGLL